MLLFERLLAIGILCGGFDMKWSRKIIVFAVVSLGFVCGCPYAGNSKVAWSEDRAKVSVEVESVRYAEDDVFSGVVVATDLKTGKVMWKRQVYVLLYETRQGLDRCVQRCRIAAMHEINGHLHIRNEHGGVYLLNLKTLEVEIVKGSLLVDYRRRIRRFRVKVKSNFCVSGIVGLPPACAGGWFCCPCR